ncbi:protein FAM43A-like [Diadema setosum]|uniref:protein FAM43A-like n=1 Tax=Diadema setosum TaxID=31175 RepID=UPI003B3A4F70
MAKITTIADAFKWRHQRFTVTPKDKEYTIHYLGSMRTARSRGDACCEYPVRKIWKNTACGERYVKVKLFVGSKGMRLVRADASSCGEKKEDREQFFSLHRITCCVADKQHPTVFAWIYRHELPRLQVSLRVHAAACTKDDKTKEIATAIACMYQTAFELFKREKLASNKKLEMLTSIDRLSDKSWSDDSDDGDDSGDNISITEAVPPTPLRKIINSRSSFKPPLAHRLSLQTQMLVIRESKDEGKENGKMRYNIEDLGILDSPTLKREEERFEDFKPADAEL